MRFQKVTIIGVGLLGGSLGLAIKRQKLADEVCGLVRNKTKLEVCKKRRVADVFTRSLSKAVSGADLIILCTPLAQMLPLVQGMLPKLKRGAIVTDVGSVKASVVEEVESLISKAGGHFVGSHPMAGGEKAGVSESRADLFECAVCVITPTKKSDRATVVKVEKFWKSVGGRLLRLTPEAHDALVSRSSHMPHVVAATLASTVLDPKNPKDIATLCATGFRDTTRIASGSPEMWRDIALTNRKQIGLALSGFVAELEKFQAALKRGDSKAIAKFFETAKQRRDNWCACCVSPTQE